ncbi:Chaperone protein ClpB OS=Lysinibacillus sphaericus OX=1421 GN=clpB PE=3 SV=1 [Lysinibacillus sphaericus]
MQFQQTDDKKPLEQFGRKLSRRSKNGEIDPIIWA